MKMTKRILSLILVLVTMCSMLAMPAYAASGWPGLSSSSYCEMVAFADIPVYRDAGLSTRGTSSPAKSYNAYISKNDEIFIYQITGSYTVVNYPTSSGRRTGMVSTSQLLGVNAPTEKVTAGAKVTTYTGASTSVKSGSIAVGDAVYKLGTTKSGFVLVIYTAVSGSRAYKAAFITKSDYERVKGNPSSNTNSGDNTSSSQNMSYALYKTSGGYLSCNFDGYRTTNGRHEGIDFARSIGSAVYSLTDGVITRVKEGYEGSDGLSTIAIYYAAADKTIIYLHSNPLNSLQVGQTVSRGQQIATESWRGVTSSRDAHTHVEVRDGRRTGAATSVNDPKLDNKNPTSFWNSMGYNVK